MKRRKKQISLIIRAIDAGNTRIAISKAIETAYYFELQDYVTKFKEIKALCDSIETQEPLNKRRKETLIHDFKGIIYEMNREIVTSQ